MRTLLRPLAALLFLASASFASGAEGDASTYDGSWNVTLTCPPYNDDEDAKGYVHRFPAEVTGGLLRGTHAREGEPGWHLLTGSIAKNGIATLTLEGIVNRGEYSVNHAFHGKPYVYRVRARFEPSSGVGQRVGKRKCEFQFRRV